MLNLQKVKPVLQSRLGDEQENYRLMYQGQTGYLGTRRSSLTEWLPCNMARQFKIGGGDATTILVYLSYSATCFVFSLHVQCNRRYFKTLNCTKYRYFDIYTIKTFCARLYWGRRKKLHGWVGKGRCRLSTGYCYIPLKSVLTNGNNPDELVSEVITIHVPLNGVARRLPGTIGK